VSQHIYTLLLGLYTKFPDGSVKNRILPCLGILLTGCVLLSNPKDRLLVQSVPVSDDNEGFFRGHGCGIYIE
jgi:hypothetical protein